jgi:dolichol-phosphate mannosyltransferase
MAQAGPDQTLRELLQRFLFGDNARFLKFAVVGASGVLVNIGVFWLATELVLGGAGSPMVVRLSEVTAILISIFTNFLLNNFWTWRDRHGDPFFARLGKYYVAASIAALLNYGLFELFWSLMGVEKLLASAIAIAGAMLLNFAIQSRWTFRR